MRNNPGFQSVVFMLGICSQVRWEYLVLEYLLEKSLALLNSCPSSCTPGKEAFLSNKDEGNINGANLFKASVLKAIACSSTQSPPSLAQQRKHSQRQNTTLQLGQKT